MTKSRRYIVSMLTTLGILIAMQIVLSRFLSIQAWNLKIGFGFIPVVVAAILYGPVAGALVGSISDFLGAMMFPMGPYFPGFTLTAFLVGMVYGLFLHRKQSMTRVLYAVFINETFGSLFLNTYWISVLNGKAFLASIPGRIVQYVLLTIVEIVLIRKIYMTVIPKLKNLVY